MFCVARFSEDQAWYRAQVAAIDPTNQTARVLFVDHGNSDVVNLVSDLRHLTADLSTVPCQAIPCCLRRGNWSTEECSRFEASVIDKPLQATFNECVDNAWLVTLKDGIVSLNELLASSEGTLSNNVVQKACFSIGDEPAVYLVSVTAPDNVVLQIVNHANDLEELMNAIAENLPQGSVIKSDCGMYCLARFTEDEAWYRAKVYFMTSFSGSP